MLLTAYSALLILPFILLHNLIYRIFDYFWPAFWNGADEPVFFIFPIIACPLGFLVGIIGSIGTGKK